MTKLHAHIETAASDCDGLITRDYVMTMTDEERASEFGDLEFHDRVVTSVVNTYSLDGEATLKVSRLNDGSVRISWTEPTEEGYRNSEATFCTDDCDDEESSYRDHRAESMGY